MQKFLIGCLGVLFVLAIAGALTAYFVVIKPTYQFATDASRMATEFQELDQRIERRGQFAPPADGQLDEARFQRFLAAQQQMRAAMAGRLEELDEKWQTMRDERRGRREDPNLIELVTAYRDLGDLLLAGKRAQVEALNAQRFSLEEYVWVRNQVYRALGEEIAVTAFGEQGHPELTRQVSDDVIAMVSPHRDEIMEAYALAWFGL